ncbi:hypothetical protein BGZ65_008972 [Modicella reniformis]|uniref:Uncharacterized protein n=1 Tax=Modicella reniformis TaxID=1440133 RepID=A0A9P6MK20_9FUNG|nr:hypothetical protein BGZ65_008972 [Modicella reniformis]
MSQAVIFLPTDLPENRIRVLKRARELNQLGRGSTDIFLSDKFVKYLKRPRSQHPAPVHDLEQGPEDEPMPIGSQQSGATTITVDYEEGQEHDNDEEEQAGQGDDQVDFENMTYVEFIELRPEEEPPCCSGAAQQTLPIPDAFMSLLMLYRPTGRDVPDWIDRHGDDASKYRNMAVDYFNMEQLRQPAPALATMINDEQLIVQPPAIAITMEALYQEAPTILHLTDDQ